jgi:hypothetical protein
MTENQGGPEGTQDDEGVAKFSGAMDELVSKYDQIIDEFKEILDKQTRRIFNDPELDEKDNA